MQAAQRRRAADARAAELTAKGKGTHFVTRTKEPMADNAPGLGAAIPRPEVAIPQAAVKEAAAAAANEDEDEEVETDDDEDAEVEVEGMVDDVILSAKPFAGAVGGLVIVDVN